MRKNKFLAISASVLALMPIGTPRVLAEEPVATVALEDSKSAEIKYNVDQVYEWNIHSGIDFGKNKGVNQSVGVKSNLVSVTKNVLEEGNKLVIKVKGNGEGNGFTITNGGKEKLNYSINDGTKDLGVNETILEVPAGINQGNKNLEFKLKTANKRAEIAGVYNGVVTYTAEINEPIKTGKILTIEGKDYTVIENVEGNQYKVMAIEGIYEKRIEGETFLDNDYYNQLPEKIRNAIVETSIQERTASDIVNNNPIWKETGETKIHKVFIPSWEEVTKVYGSTPEELKTHFGGDFVWLRDYRMIDNPLYIHGQTNNLSSTNYYDYKYLIQPTFVIDLSKADYTIK